MVAAAVEAEEEAAALRRSMAAEAQVAGSFAVHIPSHLVPSNFLLRWCRVVFCGEGVSQASSMYRQVYIIQGLYTRNRCPTIVS